MSAILCVPAKHLTVLCPQSTKYAHESAQLMAKTLRLFRQSLSRPLTKDGFEALMGTALLINYVSWVDVGFLEDVGSATESAGRRLDLSQDPLFFLSPGILQVWFQAIPVFIDGGSVFATHFINQNPRLNIEEALAKSGENPARFVEPFMRIWDDPHYQILDTCAVAESAAVGGHATPYAWHLLRGLQTEMSRCHSFSLAATPVSEGKQDWSQKLEHFREAVVRITTECSWVDPSDTSATASSSSSQLARSSFEAIVRRMSPLLCCASLASTSSNPANSLMSSSSNLPRRADIEQLFYGFPVLCCRPFSS